MYYKEEPKLQVTTGNPGGSLTPIYMLTPAAYAECLTLKLWLFISNFFLTFGF